MAKVLIVDDEEAVLHSLQLLLRSEDHVVETCRNGNDALDRLARGAFDLLMTDIRMSPLDGIDLIKEVHARTPDLPIVVVSAYTSEATEELSRHAGCRAYVKKPFRIQEVLDAVHLALGTQKAG